VPKTEFLRLFCVGIHHKPQTPHARTATHCWHHAAQWYSLGVHWPRLGSRLLLGEAEMGPGHRQNQNGGQQQERHLNATGGHFRGEWGGGCLAGCCWCVCVCVCGGGDSVAISARRAAISASAITSAAAAASAVISAVATTGARSACHHRHRRQRRRRGLCHGWARQKSSAHNTSRLNTQGYGMGV
jgi:hypothetical protein